MFENNSKFPKFLIYLQLVLSIFILIAMFFDLEIVGIIYFVSVVVAVVFLILDKKYGPLLTNYKLAFFFFDLINLVSVISVVYYEFAKHTTLLNVFLCLLMAVEVAMMIIDVFVLKNKNITQPGSVLVDFLKLGSMICILTYFFKISILFYAIDALVFEGGALAVKILIGKKFFLFENKKAEKVSDESEKIEKIIHSDIDDVGGLDV